MYSIQTNCIVVRMAEIEVVALDFDDTLCPSEGPSYELENRVLATMDRGPIDRDLYRKHWGVPLLDVIGDLSPGIDVDTFATAWQVEIAESAAAGHIDIVPDENYKALDRFLEMGKTVVLLTNRAHVELAHLLIPEHPLATRLHGFYYEETVVALKPSPKVFDTMLEDYEVGPDQCLYVGDTVKDARAACGAGLHFVACLENGLTTPEDFASLPVDRFIYRFPDIVETVASIEAM